MKRGTLGAGVAALMLAASVGHQAWADEEAAADQVQNDDVEAPTRPPHTGHRGGTVALDVHGLLVVERNGSAVVRVDRDGAPVISLAFGGLLGQVVTDGGAQAFVADRTGNRVVRLDTSRSDALAETMSVEVADPYGLALSPDGQTIYATSVADHRLVAIDTQTMKVSWSTTLRAEPRGVAVSPDGTRATVGFLSSGALAEVFVDTRGDTVRWHALDPRDHVKLIKEDDGWGEMMVFATVAEARSRFSVPTDTGRRHARSVFSVAYLGNGQVVAPHQLSTPQMKRIPSRSMQDSYGGGPDDVPAIVHQLAVVSPKQAGMADVEVQGLGAVHQPRAMAYDATNDRLFVAGYGNDQIMSLANASLPTANIESSLRRRSRGARDACGPDGMVYDDGTLWVHCSLTRTMLKLEPEAFEQGFGTWRPDKRGVSMGPELAASVRGEAVERGAEIFRRGGDFSISDGGTMACSSCHPDGRQDGLSWRLGGSILQTPMLRGRVHDTEPYKWSGADESLRASFRHTIQRLGGSSLSRRQLSDLEAYVRWLPSAQRPTVTDAAAVERGEAIFTTTLECTDCHGGDTMADGNQYPFDAWGLEQTDTPSLEGLGHTAPYYHDGSATSLYALVTDKGSVHEMADFSVLSDAQKHDLIAYLETL